MIELPSGTVTFLLTDVEGSTALWEQAPEAMRPALARHDTLFEEVVQQHGGIHIRPRGEGDSRFAVFAGAPAAAAAALAIQRGLAAEDWPTPRPIKVRIGIHTGEAELRDGDYYGSAVNRCARLRGIGHGGQILASEATAALVRGALPSGAIVSGLGDHRLKDLVEPERVSQLTASDLVADFPPLTSLDAHPHNLPMHPTALLGREHEVAEITSLLRRDVRLVTLTGPGGTGKTRLGLQVAAELVEGFEHGVFLVELAPISDPALTPSAIAQALGLRDLSARPVVDVLKGYLRGRTVLLVLDNFEQIVAAAPTVADLLAGCPGLKALVTSRAPLVLRGEHEYAVRPLALPDPERPSLVEALSRHAATALFIERATSIRPDFAVTEDNAPAVADICARLDGLPLAIELAAARIRLLNPQAMLARLEHRLALLIGGARDLPARQRTLRGAIAWSYDLLEPGEQALFRRLSSFVGSWTLEAAEAVCDTDDDLGLDVLDGMTSLVANSLVRRVDGLDNELRYGMLETIREFAAEQLEASGERPSLRDRHLDHYHAFAEAAEAELHGLRQAEWFDRLEIENDNLRAALEWSCAASESGVPDTSASPTATSRLEKGIELADALEFFWVLRGRGRENLPRVLAQVELAPPGSAARARALLVAAHVRGIMLGDYQAALPLAAEAESIWRALGDTHGIAMSLVRRGMIAAFGTSDFEDATALLSEARAGFRQLGGAAGPENPITSFLAQAARGQGDLDRALALLDESLAESRSRGDGHAVAYALREFAVLRHMQGDREQAIAILRECLAMLEPLKDLRCAHDCLVRLAALLHTRGDPTEMARLFGAAQGLRDRSGQPMSPGLLVTQDEALTAVRQLLTPETFAAAWTEGRMMSLEQSIAYALVESGSS